MIQGRILDCLLQRGVHVEVGRGGWLTKPVAPRIAGRLRRRVFHHNQQHPRNIPRTLPCVKRLFCVQTRTAIFETPRENASPPPARDPIDPAHVLHNLSPVDIRTCVERAFRGERRRNNKLLRLGHGIWIRTVR